METATRKDGLDELTLVRRLAFVALAAVLTIRQPHQTNKSEKTDRATSDCDTGDRFKAHFCSFLKPNWNITTPATIAAIPPM